MGYCKLLILPTLILTLSHCRSVEEITGNTPIIDTQGVNMAQYEVDLEQCNAYADQVQVARQATVGTIAGAAIGGVFGAVIGDSNTAQRGAGVGAVGGGARGVGSGLREREMVIRRCLTGRGYRVLN